MFDICKQKTIAIFAMVFLEAPTRFELVIEVLQTFALPLGYGAMYEINYNKYSPDSQERFI